ncbi:16S rRNA (cytosine(967)-C(5))-methyltransferase RsmB [Robbsia andropogonis]|uniref:16S rRNA (cytosine(967)-C(5))-methyltransferase RsmB n=1 Tax=Robbsia andropogonis TaxID=28092 RepID=UPI001EED14B0|nr:16S rRNA (cytosine(967)-C(5))-methyltransferase RsmB [Robbsia andropogonis]
MDSLAFALDVAASAVGAVRQGASLPSALQTAFQARAAMTAHASVSADHASSDWRGASQDIAYRAIRALGLTDALIAEMVAKPPAPPVRDLLACALTLLVAADDASIAVAGDQSVAPVHATTDERDAASTVLATSESSSFASLETPRAQTAAPFGRAAPYAAHTVVDQAVTAAAAAEDTRFARGMVNAVLRTFLREAPVLRQRVAQQRVARWSYPEWWIDAVRRAWPTQWQAILEAGNKPAPMTLRVNTRQSSPDAYLVTLSEAGIVAYPAAPSGVRLSRAVPVNRLPGFSQGAVSVQDAGAQRAALLLDVRDGMRVLDACAAPGGKTGHLLELADIELVALESDAGRVPRITENLQRLGMHADIRIGDAARLEDWWDGRSFDRVLADVPCSASGIVRRHPDIRWLRRPADIGVLVQTQRRILNALWQTVASGGELLYVTCSIFPEEGEEQARWFEGGRQDAVRLDAPGQLTPVVAASGSDADHDGFFYARFRKR